MIRLALYFLSLLIFTLAASWLIEHDGQLTMEWLGYQIEASVMVVMLVLAVTVMLCSMLFYWLLRIRLALSRSGKLHQERRRNAGMQALFHGMVALAEGDIAKAKKALNHSAAQKIPFSGLFQAQIAQAEGDQQSAAEYFSSMLPFEETEVIALRGLAAQAYNDKNYPEATRLAEKALEINPAFKWALVLLAELYQHEGCWNQALLMLESMAKHKLQTSAEIKRQTSLLLYKRSKTSPDNALYYAALAYKTASTMDNTLLLITLLIEQDKKWRALRVLKKEWKLAPHPELAALFLKIYEQATPKQRLSKMEDFAALHNTHHESHLAVAKVAIEAGELSKARTNLRASIALKETRNACILMAELEKKSYSDAEKVEEWLQRALAVSSDREFSAEKKPVRNQLSDLSQVLAEVD